MDINRLWVLGSVILIGATAVLGWVLGISPMLSESSVANAERVAVEAQNSTYESQAATLKKKFDGIGDLKSDLAALKLAVPEAADIPAFLAQLDAIAQQHQVTLTAISVSDAQPYVPVVVAPVVTEATPAEGTAPTSTPAPTTAPTATEVAAALAPVPNKLITASNFVSVPISLTVSGSYGNVMDFIEGLQKGERLVMVTTFATSAAEAAPSATQDAANTPPAASDQVTTTISTLIYVLLDPAAAVPIPAAPTTAG